MKIFKNRYFFLAVSFIIAVVAAFTAVLSAVNLYEDTCFVVRVKDTVLPGTLITDDMLETVKVGKLNLPENIIKEKSFITGKYSNTEIFPGDNLFPERFTERKNTEDAFMYELSEKEKAVSVSLKSDAAGFSGRLEKGDIVDVITYIQEGGSTYVSEDPELKNLEILAVNKTGNDQQNRIECITFRADKGQALKLIEAEYSGILHVVFSERK